MSTVYKWEDFDGTDDWTNTITEECLIEESYHYWKSKLIGTKRDKFISVDIFLDEWLVVHWAWKIEV